MSKSHCANIDEEMTRYIYDAATAEERVRVEKHLAACPDCLDEVIFTQEFNNVLRKQPLSSDAPGEPCPSVDLIVDLEDGQLEGATAHNTRAHILHCRNCRAEYLNFHRLTQMKFEEKILAAENPPPAKSKRALSEVILEHIPGKAVPHRPKRSV